MMKMTRRSAAERSGDQGVSLLDQWYTNLYCAVFKTETDGTRQIDFMDRMAMLWRLERDYRSIDDNPVNTGVQIYETVAVVFCADPVDWFVFLKMETKKKIKGRCSLPGRLVLRKNH